MAGNKVSHEALLTIEQPLIKVPLDFLQISLRNSRRTLEKDFSFLTSSLSAPSEISVITLETSINRLQSLKRKLQESNNDQLHNLKRLKSRTTHLQKLYEIQTVDQDTYKRWTKTRLERFIIDYLLRYGYHATASFLVRLVPGLHDLVDMDLFNVARSIEVSLGMKSCTDCLHWCAENKLALRKSKSPLEFNLRVQEFVEMIRDGQRLEAIAYAKKFFAPWSDSHLKQIQQVMALLVFGPKTKSPTHKAYFDVNCWKQLASQFRLDSFQLYSLPAQPLLSIALQSGLPALKMHACYSPHTKNIHCPVCTYPLDELAKGLPYSHHVNSCVVCLMSGEVMDENNYPLVLPNGNAYSVKALEKFAEQHNGRVTDPRTGKSYHLGQCKKAFLT